MELSGSCHACCKCIQLEASCFLSLLTNVQSGSIPNMAKQKYMSLSNLREILKWAYLKFVLSGCSKLTSIHTSTQCSHAIWGCSEYLNRFFWFWFDMEWPKLKWNFEVSKNRMMVNLSQTNSIATAVMWTFVSSLWTSLVNQPYFYMWDHTPVHFSLVHSLPHTCIQMSPCTEWLLSKICPPPSLRNNLSSSPMDVDSELITHMGKGNTIIPINLVTLHTWVQC